MMTRSNILEKLNISAIVQAVRGLFNKTAAAQGTASDTAQPGGERVAASAFFHPDLSHGSDFDARVTGRSTRLPWAWAGMSALAVGGSTYTNIIGFRVLLPNQSFAAGMMAVALEVFVAGTSLLLMRSKHRANPALILMTALFGLTSITFSVAGLSAGTNQYQAGVNKPIFALEEAHKAEKTQAEAAAQTETAAVARIKNELSFLTQHSNVEASLNGPETGYVRDQDARRANLNDLLDQWKRFDYSNDLAAAKTTDQIWPVLQKKYAQLEALTSETSKLTKGAEGAAIPMPTYPVPEVTEAKDAHMGANDATGLYSIFHPSPKMLIYLLVALCLDGGPLLAGMAMNPAEARKPDEDEEGADLEVDPETPISPQEDWASRVRGVKIISDDLKADPLATAGDGLIAAAVETRQFVEQGALENATRARALEIFAERTEIERRMASIGLKPEIIEAQVDKDFARLQRRQEREMEVLDGEHNLRIDALLGQQEIKGAQNRLNIAQSIAALQADLDAVGASPGGNASYQAEREQTHAH